MSPIAGPTAPETERPREQESPPRPAIARRAAEGGGHEEQGEPQEYIPREQLHRIGHRGPHEPRPTDLPERRELHEVDAHRCSGEERGEGECGTAEDTALRRRDGVDGGDDPPRVQALQEPRFP